MLRIGMHVLAVAEARSSSPPAGASCFDCWYATGCVPWRPRLL